MLRNEMLSLPANWEAILEQMMLTQLAGIKRERIYICSPCRSDTVAGAVHNMKAARIYMFYAYIHFPGIPKAPHAYLPVLLDDNSVEERALALFFGLKLLEDCSKMYVCGDKLSEGMFDEITEALIRGIPVQVFNRRVFELLREGLAMNDIDAEHTHYEEDHLHFALAMGADELAPYWKEDHDAKLLPTG
jgi:hypothetical protein